MAERMMQSVLQCPLMPVEVCGMSPESSPSECKYICYEV